MPESSDTTSITITLPAEWVARLEALAGDTAGGAAGVLQDLADHAQQGVYRPGSWERGWLTQAFGFGWIEALETDASNYGWQHPKGWHFVTVDDGAGHKLLRMVRREKPPA